MTLLAPIVPPRRGDPSWSIAQLWPRQGEWSESEYLSLVDQTNHFIELGDGMIEVLEMPKRRHQRRARFFADALRAFCKPRDLGEEELGPYPVRLWANKFREPDVVFALAKNAHKLGDDFADGCDLVVEIVSSDRRHDLVTKRREYARAKIREYWIIDADEEVVLVLFLRGGKYVVHSRFERGKQASGKLLPGFEVDVNAVLDASRD